VGTLPLEEPEAKAVADFILARPNIAGVMSYHTNAGALPRAFGDKSDEHSRGVIWSSTRRIEGFYPTDKRTPEEEAKVLAFLETSKPPRQHNKPPSLRARPRPPP
jgi:hypothetical protein